MTSNQTKLTGQALENLLLAKLNDQVEPLTVKEIRQLVLQDTGVAYHDIPVRTALYALIDRGLIASREETETERRLRAGGGTPLGKSAHIYFTTIYGDNSVPRRNVTEAVDGVHLVSSDQVHWNGGRGKAKRRRKVVPAAASKPIEKLAEQPSKIDLEQIIDQLVEARVVAIRAENQALRDQLAAIKKILG